MPLILSGETSVLLTKYVVTIFELDAKGQAKPVAVHPQNGGVDIKAGMTFMEKVCSSLFTTATQKKECKVVIRVTELKHFQQEMEKQKAIAQLRASVNKDAGKKVVV